jgi:hypothetical protein
LQCDTGQSERKAPEGEVEGRAPVFVSGFSGTLVTYKVQLTLDYGCVFECNKIRDVNNPPLKEEGFIVAHCFRGFSPWSLGSVVPRQSSMVGYLGRVELLPSW